MTEVKKQLNDIFLVDGESFKDAVHDLRIRVEALEGNKLPATQRGEVISGSASARWQDGTVPQAQRGDGRDYPVGPIAAYRSNPPVGSLVYADANHSTYGISDGNRQVSAVSAVSNLQADVRPVSTTVPAAKQQGTWKPDPPKPAQAKPVPVKEYPYEGKRDSEYGYDYPTKKV
jgi:hypothetical protein